MSKSKKALALKPIEPVDWMGVRLQRAEHEPATTIFAQGDPATSVMYIEKGAVRLSVLSHASKEAVVALLEASHFFGTALLLEVMPDGRFLVMRRHLRTTPSSVTLVVNWFDAVRRIAGR